ncbi:MAG: serine/threonine dehydratase [Nocardioidaceae bacterium]
MKQRGPDRADVAAAADRIAGQIRRTPVMSLSPAETGLPGTIVLKLENLQHSGSYKARGALHSMLTLADETAGVCAASGGNHGGTVAWAAQSAGLPADVFVPSTAPAVKVARIRDYGATAHLVAGSVKEALEECVAFSAKHGAALIHPYDTWETTAGAGTVGLEVAEQVPDADVVLLACGGGGLYTGVAAALAGSSRVQPVEPRLCPTLAEALAAGEPVDVAVGGVAVDSLGAARIGELALQTALAHEVRPVLVDEDDILAARRYLWSALRMLAEPGACVALAAALSGQIDIPADSTAVVVVSGGNNETLPGSER